MTPTPDRIYEPPPGEEWTEALIIPVTREIANAVAGNARGVRLAIRCADGTTNFRHPKRIRLDLGWITESGLIGGWQNDD
jgi:hypothetical protein